MSLFTDLKATYIQLTGKQVPVGTSTALEFQGVKR